MGVSRCHIVDVFIELQDGDSIAGVAHEAENIIHQLVLGLPSSVIIKEIERSFLMAWIIDQHIEARAAEMGLHAGIIVQDVVIDLASAIGIGELDQPVALGDRGGLRLQGVTLWDQLVCVNTADMR